MGSPFTASPDPLNEAWARKKSLRCIVFAQTAGPAGRVVGRIPARMLLPPATSKNAGQSHWRRSSAMRSRANPFPIAPRSKSSTAAFAEDGVLVRQQIPLRKRRLCFRAAGVGKMRHA